MYIDEIALRNASVGRIAYIFSVESSSVSQDAIFGKDLKASFISDFRRNELDMLLDDVHDVANRRLRADLSSGRKVINSVRDYCDYMVLCFGLNPEGVRKILGLNNP